MFAGALCGVPATGTAEHRMSIRIGVDSLVSVSYPQDTSEVLPIAS
jgi:hypothetical protein